jgi:hypothetical protein
LGARCEWPRAERSAISLRRAIPIKSKEKADHGNF